VAQAPPQGQATGSAGQTPINGSGIQSELLFLDTGSDMNGLVVSGRASGLDPTQTYFSLLYNNGSEPANHGRSDVHGVLDRGPGWHRRAVSAENRDCLCTVERGGHGFDPKGYSGNEPPFFEILQACGEIRRNPYRTRY